MGASAVDGVRLIVQYELTVEHVTLVAEVSRQSVFTDCDTLLTGDGVSPPD